MDCRPINIVEDQGLQEIIQIASGDPFYKAPSRGTVVARINELYDNEKAMKMELLAQAPFIALTGDHWTSVNNQNYLGVTGHLIDNKWQLHSFALGVVKTEERHFADACARQFIQVSDEWKITDKVTTIGTDSARNMIAAARILPFDHLPCIAHMIQRLITVSLSNSGFDGALAKCRKIVGHFKHSPANAAELKAQQASHGQDEEPLIQDVPTRWNSTLAMITRTLAQQKHNLALLTAAEYDRLARLETLLEPCKYVTNLLGGDKYVSCSAVLPALCHLQRKMEVATALDPRFKDLKCMPRAEREEVWRVLCEVLNNREPPRAEVEPEPPKKKMALLLMATDSESDDEAQSNKPLDRYRAEPSIDTEQCPLQWWSTHTGAHGEGVQINECTVFDVLCQSPSASSSAVNPEPTASTSSQSATKGKMSAEKVEECHRKVTSYVVKRLHPFSDVEALIFSIAQDHYLTVTAHYLVEGKMKKKVLQTKAVYTAQTGPVVAEEIGDVLTEFGIFDKVVPVTVDNAANMDVAIKWLQFVKLGCFAHTLNLAAQSLYSLTAVTQWTAKIRTIIVWRSSMAKVVLREK
ncbi:hypothetical protein SKAU_G00060980 [Synaphobranchus kaupii]|uniref:Uncharacterized protein n=1 Tax=Synaphobranchus kaupii TaxID=118154 RepID=A0A9Q1G4T0_SYNKA|nr:hypothetical protein SKAU_G00060980 [Synaphobranchus kaupii]